jgi:hypothetical protein
MENRNNDARDLRGFRKVSLTIIERLEHAIKLLFDETPSNPFGGGGGSSQEGGLLSSQQEGVEPWRDYS